MEEARIAASSVLPHRRRALLVGACLLAPYGVLDYLHGSMSSAVARGAWLTALVVGARFQDERRCGWADRAARVIGLTSGVAATFVVQSSGGAHGLNFGFLYAVPFCVLVLIPDLPSSAALAGIATTIGGAVLLLQDHQPTGALAQWVARSVSMGGLAAWGTLLYGRLVRSELAAQRERIDALTQLAEGKERFREQLATSEALFRDLAERAIVGVYVIQDGVFQYVNPRLAEIFGYTREELVGRTPVKGLVHGDDRDVLVENGRRLADEVEGLHAELRGIRKNGDTIDAEMFGSRTVYRGRPAIIGTLLDVTDRKRAEAERVRIQKLESVGVLAGGIAHDFNNLLAVVMSNVSVARQHAERGSVVGDALADAEGATVRARDLTAQLLTFARGGKPVRKPTRLEPLLRTFSTFAARGSRAVCDHRIPADLWPVEADDGQIGQVVQNLVLNAVQAMPGGGVVQVQAENLTAEQSAAAGLTIGRCVRVTVSDDGPGIPPEIVHRVFDPYFTTKPSGSGLGLASAHSIAAQHGGQIGVQACSGPGAKLYFALPATDAPVAAPEREVQVPLRSGRIVVMDDDEYVRRAARRVLTHLGYEVSLARDGEEALAMCAEARARGMPVDAVVMDLTIPNGMGGADAVRLLRDREPGVKAIVSSGYSSDPIMADHAKYGFAGVVAKPFRVEELRDVLAAVVGTARQPGSAGVSA